MATLEQQRRAVNDAMVARRSAGDHPLCFTMGAFGFRDTFRDT